MIPLHPEEEQEKEQEAKTNRLVAEFLSRPRLNKRHKLDEHLWDMSKRTCIRCGITLIDFHSVLYGNGLPCK